MLSVTLIKSIFLDLLHEIRMVYPSAKSVILTKKQNKKTLNYNFQRCVVMLWCFIYIIFENPW